MPKKLIGKAKLVGGIQIRQISTSQIKHLGKMLSKKTFKTFIDTLVENFFWKGQSLYINSAPIYILWRIYFDHIVGAKTHIGTYPVNADPI